MSGKKTLIIFIVFAIAAGAYYFDQKRVTEKTTRQEAESRLVLPEQKDINQLTISTGGDTTKLAKQGDDWRLTSPIDARVDRATLDAILGELDRARKKDPFEVAEASLKDYGLDNPTAKVDVQATGQNYVQQFAVGAETPDNSEVYVRVGAENKVYTLPSSLKTQLTKTPLDLRDKRLVPATINNATSLTLASTTSTVLLAKRDNRWQLVQPVQGKGDETKITEVLNEINNAKRSDFITSPTDNLAEYGLDQPQLTIALFVEGADPRTSAALRTLKVGNIFPGDSTKRYATLEGEPEIFAVPETVLTKARPNVDELRAKDLFTITTGDVGRITFDVRGNPVSVEKDSAGQWRFVGEPDTKLDQAVVSSKVDQLLRLKALNFLTSAPATTVSGLDDPNLRLTVSNQAGTTTETLVTGRKDDTADHVYAFVPATQQYLTLNWTEPGNFFVTREQLVDKTLFSFSEDSVQKMDISEGTRTVTLDRTAGGAWEARGESKTLQVDGPTMTALLYGITGLSWDRTLSPALESEAVLIKTQNLERPARELTLYDKEGKEVARLGFGGEETKYAYIRAGQDRYYAIDKVKLASVVEGINKALGSGTVENTTP